MINLLKIQLDLVSIEQVSVHRQQCRSWLCMSVLNSIDLQIPTTHH